MSWNCGGLTTQLPTVRKLLLEHRPALLLLQEARDTSCGTYSALRAEVSGLGYTVTANASLQLVAIHRHGLCIAPVKAHCCDDGFRIQRLVLVAAGRRFNIRPLQV